MIEKSNKNIVVIGGGTGIFSVLTGLKKYFKNITAIITMADDGGSSGILREDFGVLPPGDVRRALIALSNTDNKLLNELFNYRFNEGRGLKGHSFGNLILLALERITKDFEKAIEAAGKILNIQGKIIPVTLDNIKLYAELENGEIIKGERNIDIPKHLPYIPIKKVWLEPKCKINPRARKAILEADYIIIGPGDLYSSIIPNILVKGVKEAIKRSKAKVIYIVNIMTKFGETNKFKASDFFFTLEKYLGKKVVDYLIVNKEKPSEKRLKPYKKENADFVIPDIEKIPKYVKIISGDLIRKKGLLRHDPEKIAKLIYNLVETRGGGVVKRTRL